MSKNNLLTEKIVKLDIARAERDSLISSGKDDAGTIAHYTEQTSMIELLTSQVHHLRVKELEAQVISLQAEQFDKQKIYDEVNRKYLDLGRELNSKSDELRIFMNTGGRAPNQENISKKVEFDKKITDLKGKIDMTKLELQAAKYAFDGAQENTKAAMMALEQLR